MWLKFGQKLLFFMALIFFVVDVIVNIWHRVEISFRYNSFLQMFYSCANCSHYLKIVACSYIFNHPGCSQWNNDISILNSNYYDYQVFEMYFSFSPIECQIISLVSFSMWVFEFCNWTHVAFELTQHKANWQKRAPQRKSGEKSITLLFELCSKRFWCANKPKIYNLYIHTLKSHWLMNNV